MNKQEYLFLSQLLEKGYPLLDAFTFLGKDMDEVKSALEHGATIEEIFIQNQKGRFYTHLAFFLKVSSLSGAIQSALHMTEFEEGVKKKLIKQCSYPLFLLVFAFVIMVFFTGFIIPQMMNSFDITDDFSTLMLLLNILQYAFILFVCLIVTFALIYIVMSFQPKKRSEWIYRNRTWLPLCKDVLSYQLSGYLYELHNKGISTRMSFLYLKHMNETSLLHMLMQEMITALEIGEDLLTQIETTHLLNASFKQMYKIGTCNDAMCEMLEMFMKQQEQVWNRLIKRCGLGIQCAAYLFIACMVLVVYQIMLVPLGMLNTM